jgi:hypothetical protein
VQRAGHDAAKFAAVDEAGERDARAHDAMQRAAVIEQVTEEPRRSRIAGLDLDEAPAGGLVDEDVLQAFGPV